MDEKGKNGKTPKGNLPRKEADINTIAAEVAASWEKRPQITLLWTNVDQLKESSAVFGASYAGRKTVKGSRRSVTQEMKETNTEINTATEQVKNYIADLHSKRTASIHYESFGIVRVQGKYYKLPVDNDQRLYALDQLIKGLEQYGLNDRKYGKSYWSELRERFARIKSQAAKADQTSAEHISVKDGEKVLIRKTLNALVHIIKGNYPDTWKEELRAWGFQKEKY